MDNIIELKLPCKVFDIEVVSKSGQVFSISKLSEKEYEILSADKCCILIKGIEWNTIYCKKEDRSYWENYLGLNSAAHLFNILSSSNEFISNAAKHSIGMTILKQDLWETLISFIISQRKSIPAIKNSLRRIREEFGREMYFGEHKYYSFPTAEELKDVTLDDLQGLGLGYRDKYILDAIKWWNENYKTYEYILAHGTREEHMQILKQIRGVGEKVANCCCLFSLNDLDSFPVDTWIQKALDSKLFAMDDIEPFIEYGGLVQQVIFYYILEHKDIFKGE